MSHGIGFVMGLDIDEIVAITLEDQAGKMKDLADMSERVAAGHQGARDVIPILEQGMVGVTPKAEAEIMADKDLDDESKSIALRYAARAMARVSQALASCKSNQANLVMIKTGEAKALRAQHGSLLKQADVRRGLARARAESIAKGEENKEMKAANKVKPKPSPKKSPQKTPKTKPYPKKSKK